VWVFGFARTEAQTGDELDGLPSDSMLISEGRWKFEGVYGFPY
jgi:hypothetical protein